MRVLGGQRVFGGLRKVARVAKQSRLGRLTGVVHSEMNKAASHEGDSIVQDRRVAIVLALISVGLLHWEVACVSCSQVDFTIAVYL